MLKWIEIRYWFVFQDGALELESSELSFETSAEGQSVIQNKEIVPMMAVVAEMMIWANETVAEKLVKSFPTAALLRSHAPPPLDAFEEVSFLLSVLNNCISNTSVIMTPYWILFFLFNSFFFICSILIIVASIISITIYV